ncbi:MAG: type II toxin-antitoxin system HicB family antitoxin [Candidatus Jacksonbacteria bacterium]|nr:type II toxin-antitoxin system HicB family antitoxin [Candidatus Jacksonbacteria bacterium]
MQTLHYNVTFRPEPEGGFTVIVPSLPGCITYGGNLEEARAMASDAIALYVESLLEDGEPIPSDEENFSTLLRIPVKKIPSKIRAYA